MRLAAARMSPWQFLNVLFFLGLAWSGLQCGNDLEITTNALPSGQVGVAYAAQLKSKHGGDEWRVIAGNLPPGVSLSSDGELFGVPTTPGTFTFTVEVLDIVHDEINDRAAKGFAIVIQ